ncbi:MAG: hypothetical protein ACK47B_18910 [Armatimonadota bacterium]
MKHTIGPTNLPEKDGPADERGNLLAVSAAARLLGLQRTQMWRLAKENKLPSVVLGTVRHPLHYFFRGDVLRLKREREETKAAAARKRRQKAQPKLRKLLALIEAGEIDLDAMPSISDRVG